MASHTHTAFLIIPLIAALLIGPMPGAAFAQKADNLSGESPFSLEFRDAGIKDVLRAVGQAAGLNLIIADSVAGQITLSLKNVEIWEALEAILKSKGLTYVREGSIVRVVSVAEARDEDMETRVFSLGYASGRDVLEVIDKVKSDKAKVSVDTRMNAIVVKDLSLNIDRVARLLKNLDMRIPQVMIEAKIVEVSSNYARELGIQWGGKYTGNPATSGTSFLGGTTGIGSSGAGGSATGVSAPTIGSSTLYPITGDIGAGGNAYVVNLPAAIGQGSGGALGVSFGKLGGRLSLDLQLSAMQTTGNGKILSNPKIMTSNNKEAKISSGIDIPVRVLTTTTAGTTAEIKTISASLVLSTVPVITADNKISMVVRVEKSEPDFSRQVDGIPTITKRSANADLVVDTGETVVLGGIYTKSEGQAESGVPFLSQIPLIGWLFKKKSSFDTQAELLIFITPTIIRD